MNELSILKYPDPRLRRRAKPCESIDGLRDLANHMFALMQEHGGIGLAATQLGLDKRLVVVDVMKLESMPELRESISYGRFVLINPTIVKTEGEMEWDEGCLSVPDLTESVKRAMSLTVEYLDPDGNHSTLDATGLLAACIQHEIDHLDGRLFIDRLPAVRRDIVARRLKKVRKTTQRVVRQMMS